MTRHLCWMRNRLGAAAFLLLLFSASPSIAVSVHIAPSGSDETGDGSRLLPYNSLYKANYRVGPGDTIYIHQGVYTSTIAYWGYLLRLMGAPGRYITIMGAPGESKPIFRNIYVNITAEYGPSGTWFPRYLRIKNIIFQDNMEANTLYVNDGGHRENAASNIEITGVEMYGSYFVGFKFAGVDSLVLRDCIFDSSLLYNNPAAEYPGLAVDMVGCHNALVEHCRFTNLGDESSRGIGSIGLMIKGGSRNVIVRNCFIKNVYNACQIGQNTGIDYFRPPLGTMDADGDTVNYETKNVAYLSNIIVNAGIPIYFSNSREGKFCNNTVYSPKNNAATPPEYQFYHAIKIMPIAQAIGGIPMIRDRYGEVKNNVFVFGKPYWNEDPTMSIVHCHNTYHRLETFQFDNNLFYCVADTHLSRPNWNNIIFANGKVPIHRNNIYALNPKFIASAPVNPEDVRLQQGSPAITNGVSLPYVRNDYFDVLFAYPRPTIGAIEYSTERPAPSTPTLLRITPR